MQSRWFQNPYRQVFPLAYLLRDAFPETWMRIHSLPESQRYATNNRERKIILDRYSRFGTALLGERASCLMLRPIRRDFEFSPLEWLPHAKWTPVHSVESRDDEREVWNAFATPVSWNPAALRELLLAIANWETGFIIFLSKETDCIFAPYDGGADGFSFDAAFLRRMRDEFSPWRSNHPSGL